MRPNELKAEMARHGDNGNTLASALGISYVTLSRKMSGATDFTLSEITLIKKRYDLNSERVDDIFFG